MGERAELLEAVRACLERVGAAQDFAPVLEDDAALTAARELAGSCQDRCLPLLAGEAVPTATAWLQQDLAGSGEQNPVADAVRLWRRIGRRWTPHPPITPTVSFT
jgi:hypothetical protein